MLALSIDDNLEPTFKSLQEHLNLTETETAKLCVRAPQILMCNSDDNLEPKIKWLQERLNLTETQTAKLCVRAPSILAFNVDGNIEPTVDWLEQRLDLDQVELGKVIRTTPTVLTLRVDSLEQKLDCLQHILCLDDGSLKKIVVRAPNVMTYSPSTNVAPKVQWLQQQLFLAEVDVGELVRKFPPLLGMGIETNLEPTLDFFKECIGDEAAVELVVKYPTLLSYSLENRLKPRYEQAHEIGIEVDAGCLQRMAQLPDEKWLKSLDYQSKELNRTMAK
jgi:hypothetical protein